VIGGGGDGSKGATEGLDDLGGGWAWEWARDDATR